MPSSSVTVGSCSGIGVSPGGDGGGAHWVWLAAAGLGDVVNSGAGVGVVAAGLVGCVAVEPIVPGVIEGWAESLLVRLLALRWQANRLSAI